MHTLVGPCHDGMAHIQVVDGGRPPIWRVAANILNKQSPTADKGWSSNLGVRRGAEIWLGYESCTHVTLQ